MGSDWDSGGVNGLESCADFELGVCALDGEELEGVEFCARTPNVHAMHIKTRQLRIGLFYLQP